MSAEYPITFGGVTMPPNAIDFIRDALDDIKARLDRIETKVDRYDADRCDRHGDAVAELQRAEAARQAMLQREAKGWGRAVAVAAIIGTLIAAGSFALGVTQAKAKASPAEVRAAVQAIMQEGSR